MLIEKKKQINVSSEETFVNVEHRENLKKKKRKLLNFVFSSLKKNWSEKEKIFDSGWDETWWNWSDLICRLCHILVNHNDQFHQWDQSINSFVSFLFSLFSSLDSIRFDSIWLEMKKEKEKVRIRFPMNSTRRKNKKEKEKGKRSELMWKWSLTKKINWTHFKCFDNPSWKKRKIRNSWRFLSELKRLFLLLLLSFFC